MSADTFQGCRKTSEKMWFCENSDAAGIKVCCKWNRILHTISDSNSDWLVLFLNVCARCGVLTYDSFAKRDKKLLSKNMHWL